VSEDQFEYVDDSLRNKLFQRRSFYNDNDNTTLEQERLEEIPEEIMSQLEDHVGDGLARVTVAGDLGSSVSFHSAKAFVSVSVTCNNDLGDVEAVHDVLRPFVQKLCHSDHEEMSIIRDTILPADKRQHEAEPAVMPGRVSRPPKKGPAQTRTATKRGGQTVTPKGVKKPDYRR